MKHINRYAVILAGGVGNRLWPISTPECPKQFLDIVGRGKTMLQDLYQKISSNVVAENIYIVANPKHKEEIKRQIPEFYLSNIIQEPLAKNTAATVAYACFKIQKLQPHASVLILPSDVIISNDDVFEQDLDKAFYNAQTSKKLINMGIIPTRPDINFTYIQRHEQQEGGVYLVKTFTNRPNAELAETFFESGDFLWNSQILLGSITTIIDAYRDVLTDVYDAFLEIKSSLNTSKEQDLIREAFEKCPNISFRAGIVEKMMQKWVMPCNFECSDIDTLSTLYSFLDRNRHANFGNTDIIFDNSKDCYVQTKGKKNVLISNLNGFIIIDTEENLIILPKSIEEDIIVKYKSFF